MLYQPQTPFTIPYPYISTLIIWLLLWVMLNQITPPNSPTFIGEAQTVSTDKPHTCVHTRLIDEVHEWKIRDSLQLVREMGAPTIVEFFPWAYIERAPGRYDWQQADRIISHARHQGVQIIARMGLVPSWARPDVRDDYTTLNYLPDDAYDDFADFVVAFAERYQHVVHDIIIWNEPNLAFEWGYRAVDPAGYTRLLQTVYPAVKQAVPHVRILGGALAPTLEPAGSPNGMNDLLYLQAMYEAGVAGYFDALAVHSYGLTHPPSADPAPDILNFRRVELLHNIMQRYGDDRPMVITESGWNDHPRWTMGVRPSQRARYTVEALQWAEEHWPYVQQVCIWVLRYPAPTYSYPDNFTLVTTAFQRKPIYYAIQAYARTFENDIWTESEALWLPPPVASSPDQASSSPP